MGQLQSYFGAKRGDELGDVDISTCVGEEKKTSKEPDTASKLPAKMDLSKFDPLQLDEKDFIVDPDAQNVCFLPLPIFTRISEMLTPSDFYNLAQTCRYMHWRMFTYGHLMLKHHNIKIGAFEEISIIYEIVTLEGRSCKEDVIIIPRPYVYFEYLHVEFVFYDYVSSSFAKMIDYVSKAKKRTKHCCINILGHKHVCTQETFENINNLIERLNPFHLQLCFSWNHKLTVEIPNIKNIYSAFLENLEFSIDTDFLMNPCARYNVDTVQDLRYIVEEFTRNSRLQFHICQFYGNAKECRAMLENEWDLKFKRAGHFCFSQSASIPLHASIPSEHGDVEIFISYRKVVIQRKETVIGQWKDFYSNVRPLELSLW